MPVLKGLRVLPFGSGDFLVGGSVFLADWWWGFVWFVREKGGFADGWLRWGWVLWRGVFALQRNLIIFV